MQSCPKEFCVLASLPTVLRPLVKSTLRIRLYTHLPALKVRSISNSEPSQDPWNLSASFFVNFLNFNVLISLLIIRADPKPNKPSFENRNDDSEYIYDASKLTWTMPTDVFERIMYEIKVFKHFDLCSLFDKESVSMRVPKGACERGKGIGF